MEILFYMREREYDVTSSYEVYISTFRIKMCGVRNFITSRGVICMRFVVNRINGPFLVLSYSQ